jgi:hypothetical protein
MVNSIMNKRIIRFICLLITLTTIQLNAQSTASYGVVVTSLTTSSAGAVTGTPFAVPSSYAAIITWQVVSDSGTLVVNLEGSNDNVSYSTIDTTTASSVRNFGFSAVKFVRCSQASRTGGTSTSCTLVINRGFINGGNFSLNRVLTGDGTTSAPAYSFLSAPTDGFYHIGTSIALGLGGGENILFGLGGPTLASTTQLRWGSSGTATPDLFLGRNGAGKLTLTGTTPMLQFGGTTGSFPALKGQGVNLFLRTADDVGQGVLFSRLGEQNILIHETAPTISSGFGTSPSIVTPNGTAAFTINVGTGGVATSGVIGLVTAATGWNCFATDITATSTHTALETEITASTTTSATLESQNRATGAATAWATGSIIRVSCFAY